MNKVAIYARVSTEEQKERQSIDNQVDFAREFCQKNSLIPYDFYLDNGVSGTIPFEERPGGKRLLEDAAQGCFTDVLIWKIDRLSRVTLNSLTIADKLKELGVNIKSMTEPFDTSTPTGEFMFTQLASIAKLERDNIRERSITGTNRIARQGKWLGGIVPYGYKLDDNSYPVPNEHKLGNTEYSEADVIKMIYDWLGNKRLSTRKIAERLNSMNIPTHYTKDKREFYKPKQNYTTLDQESYEPTHRRKVKTSNRWNPHRIGNMVRNKMYMGIHEYGKRSNKPREIIERKVPELVSPELWSKAKERLKNNNLWASRNSKRNYLLRGLVKCSKCGRTYTGSFHRKKMWYRCNGKLNHVKIASGKQCNAKNVRGDYIEDLVWNEIKSWILNQEQLELILQSKLNEYDKEKGNWFKELSGLKDQIESKENERQNILSLYRTGIIDISDVEQQLEQVNQSKKELESMASEIKSKMVSDYSKEEVIKEINTNLDKFKNQLESDDIDFQTKRRIVETFVKEIRVNLTQDNKASLFIDTIPFRKNVKPRKRNKKVQETIDFRISSNTPGNIQQYQEDTLNIIYKFPLPSRDIGLITQHTDTDS